MPLFGPPDVDKLKANRDVPRLIKAPQYAKDWSVENVLWARRITGHDNENSDWTSCGVKGDDRIAGLSSIEMLAVWEACPNWS